MAKLNAEAPGLTKSARNFLSRRRLKLVFYNSKDFRDKYFSSQKLERSGGAEYQKISGAELVKSYLEKFYVKKLKSTMKTCKF
jgi:hypothetical protein